MLEKREKSSYNILILTMSNLVLQIIGFIYRMMLTRLVGTEAMGLNLLVMQIYSVAVSVCIPGMSIAIITLCGRLSSSGTYTVKCLVRMAFTVYLVLFTCIAAPIILFRETIAERLIGERGVALTLLLLPICIFLTGIENLFKAVHIGTGKASVTAVSELIEQSARFIFVLILLKNISDGSNTSSVTMIMLGMVLSELFSVGTLAGSYKREYSEIGIGGKANMNSNVNLYDYLIILVPATLTGIASTAFESISSLLLPGRLLLAGYFRNTALSAIGVLNGVATPLVTMPFCFVMASNNVRLPEISAAFCCNDKAVLKRLVGSSFMAAATAAFLINLPLLPFLQKLSKYFFGITPNQAIINLLSFKTAIIYFQVTSVMVLNAMMKQGLVLAFALIGEFIQLVLIYVLSANPFLHIYGYVIAMIIGECLRLIFNLLAIKREVDIRFKMG